MDDLYDRLEELEDSTCPAEFAVAKIVDDLRYRKGFDHVFDGCDDDVLIEMVEGWVAIVKEQMGL